jgi:hypothetical protein
MSTPSIHFSKSVQNKLGSADLLKIWLPGQEASLTLPFVLARMKDATWRKFRLTVHPFRTTLTMAISICTVVTVTMVTVTPISKSWPKSKKRHSGSYAAG